MQHRRSEFMAEGQSLERSLVSQVGGTVLGVAKVDRAGEMWNPVLVRGATVLVHSIKEPIRLRL